MIDISVILNSTEVVNIEVKSAQNGIPKSIWETYSSFANTFGGTIVLGIDEDKETKKFIPVGLENPDQLLADFWSVINNQGKVSANILLERHAYVQNYDGKDYVVIEVPRASRQDKPVYIGQDMFRGTYRRNHEGDYHCTKEEVKAMLRDQSDTTSDALILENVGLDVLDAETIKRYRIRFENIKTDHMWNSLPTNEFLIKIGAAKISNIDGKVHPTLGGLIFFGNFMNIVDELPDYFLDYREKLSSETRWSDRITSGDGDWSGNVFDFYFKIIDRLTADVKKPFKINSDLLRDDDTPVHKALREALANALIHADYYGRQGIVVEKDFRNIKISNPGVFRINVSDAIAGGVSDARNSRIFNMFSLIKVGERSGMGLCDLYHIWKENDFEEPIIEEKTEPDRISLTLSLEDNREDNEDNREDNTSRQNITLSKNEQIILQSISANTSISVRQIVIDTQIPKATTERVIKALKDKGYISREGSTRGKWIILK